MSSIGHLVLEIADDSFQILKFVQVHIPALWANLFQIWVESSTSGELISKLRSRISLKILSDSSHSLYFMEKFVRGRFERFKEYKTKSFKKTTVFCGEQRTTYLESVINK